MANDVLHPTVKELYASGGIKVPAPIDFGAEADAYEADHPNDAARPVEAGAVVSPAVPDRSSSAGQGKGFQFFTAYEFGELPPMDWLLKELLPRRGVGQLFGESGAGKSFIALDLVWHLAEGRSWFGWKAKRHSSGKNPHIFYLCLEGSEGFRNRVNGIRTKWYDEQGLAFPYNMHFSFDSFQLFDDGEVSALIEAVNAIKGDVPPFVVIDTQAQAVPALNVNDSEIMSKIVIRAEAISKAVDGFVLLVAHSGKTSDPTKGALGSITQKGPCNTQIAVLKNNGETRTVSAVKVKDGRDGIMYDFTLVDVVLGHDEDGDEIKTCVVSPLDRRKESQGRKKLTAKESLALACFKDVRAGSLRPVTDEEWRAEFFKRCTSEKENSKRAQFSSAKSALQEKGLLLCQDNVYTLSIDAPKSDPC